MRTTVVNASNFFSLKKYPHQEREQSQNNELLAPIVSSHLSLDNTVQYALELAQNYLLSFASSSNFKTQMQIAFGNDVDVSKLQQNWQNQVKSVIPKIQILSKTELGEAVGGFSSATNTIYLSQDYLRQYRSNIDAVASVLLEEIGHAVDKQLNTVDAPGDEGEIFSVLARGERLEQEQLERLKVENDAAIITLDGQIIEIEKASIPLREGGQEGRTETITLDKKGSGSAEIFYEMYTVPDDLQLRYEGKTIFQTGFTSGSQTTKVNIPKGNSDKLDVILTANPSISTTRWQYKIDTTTCPNPLPLQVTIVSGKREEKDGKCIGEGIIHIGRQGLFPMLKIDGRVEYDDKTISVDGIVYSLIGIGDVKNVPLFKSKSQFDIDVKTATASFTEDTSLTNQFKLGGLDVDFNSFTLNPNGIALGAKFKLIEDLGLPDFVFSGSDALLIRPDDVKLGSSVKFSAPTFKDFKLFNFLPIKEFSGFAIEYIAPEDTLKIQGKLGLELASKASQTEVTADLAGENYIQIKGGKPDIKGSLTIGTDLKLPKGWGLREVRLNIDTENKDIGGGAKLTLPFGRTIKVDGDIGFKLKLPPPLELNKLALSVDNLNLPIPGYPLVFFQRVAGAAENFAKSDEDPIEFSGGVSVTLGPQILEVSAIRFDADGKISSEEFSGTGTVTVINDKILKAQGTSTLNWNKKFYETKGNFSILDGLIKTDSGFKVDTGFNINMSGKASVNFPNSLAYIGGAQIGSGNYLLNFTNNEDLSDDFAAGWTTINIQQLGIEINFVAGFKQYFDGKFETIGAKNVPPIGSYEVLPNTEWIMMGADWENTSNNVQVKVKTPNGTILNESDFAATGKIAIVDKLSNSTTKVVLVRNPEPGIWDLDVVDTTGLGGVKYSAFRDSVTPSIAVTAPTVDVTGTEVNISYNAFDTDSNAKVSLFYDTDNQGFDGILIKDGLAENDGAGSFIWNTQGIAIGDYYIYAMVIDENNPPAFSYSTGKVRLTEAADLSITKQVNADSINLGENLTYTIAVTNNGTNIAKGVTLTDTLPENVNFVSASLSPTNQSNNDLIFDFGNLESGKSTTVNITIKPTKSGIISNTATVKAKTFDPDATNDVAIIDSTVKIPTPTPTDISISGVSSPATINLGDQIIYNITATNNSFTKAAGVKLTNYLPSGIKDVSVTSSKGSAFLDSNEINVELGDLNAAEKATVTITATAIASGTLFNSASIISNEDDTNTTNNHLDLSTIVNPIAPAPADLELTQTVNKINPQVGEEVNFTITLSNKGPGIASSVKVTDILPSGLSFVKAAPEQGIYDSQTGIWDVGNIRDNLNRNLIITAKVNADTAITNTAQITAVTETDPDSTPGNNNPAEDDQVSVTLNGTTNTAKLTKTSDNIFTISGANKPTLKVSLAEVNSNYVNELGVFVVDDDKGTINGIAPNQSEYVQAPLDRSKVILSAISNPPNGFKQTDVTSLLKFNSGDKLGFFLVKNNAIDAVRSMTSGLEILFAQPNTQKIETLEDGRYQISWEDSFGSSIVDFKDLVIQATAISQPLPLGAKLQGNPQEELIDLQDVTGKVNAEFILNREAAFDNVIGFYKVSNAQGGIDFDGNGTIDIRPGDAGYTQAALQRRIVGLDMAVNNQGTATFTTNLDGGAIYAPFIVADGRPEAILDDDSNNDPSVYFAFSGANPGNFNHIRLLGNNTWGFEDLTLGGDMDYNDVVVRANLNRA